MARHWLRVLYILIFSVVCALLCLAEPAVIVTMHKEPIILQAPNKPCPPDEEQKSPCTITRDTVCHCKPDTFRRKESPEFCKKCYRRCTDREVEESPCTPWSDRKCIPKESSTKVTGEAGATGEPVITNSDCTSPHASSYWKYLVAILVLLSLLVLLVIGWILSFQSGRNGRTTTNHVQNFKCVSMVRTLVQCLLNSQTASQHNMASLEEMAPGIAAPHTEQEIQVNGWHSSPPRGPEDQDNNLDESLSFRDLPPTLVSKQEINKQNAVTDSGATEQSPVEAEHLLVSGRQAVAVCRQRGENCCQIYCPRESADRETRDRPAEASCGTAWSLSLSVDILPHVCAVCSEPGAAQAEWLLCVC
uniref:Tumor necrosis factor receptor superfamily member 10D-like isoform X2 n=1 Tax=Castor canadensis TaxID=51338 RepID=A0A8B7UXP8_CASCN|nr:tumor necrosis factor receptor superfamily member 10D-like isoform X2 [Castor canadensis]